MGFYHFRGLTKMVRLLLPVVATVLAQAHGSVLNIPCRVGNGSGSSLVLLFLGNGTDQFDREEAYPQHEIDHPPPRANEDPPQDAVSCLLILGFCFGNGCLAQVLLMELDVNIVASALRTEQSGSIFAIHNHSSFLYHFGLSFSDKNRK